MGTLTWKHLVMRFCKWWKLFDISEKLQLVIVGGNQCGFGDLLAGSGGNLVAIFCGLLVGLWWQTGGWFGGGQTETGGWFGGGQVEARPGGGRPWWWPPPPPLNPSKHRHRSSRISYP